MINFMCYLFWTKDGQIAGKTVFLTVSVRVYLGEIGICFSRLSKDIHPHQCGQILPSLLGARVELKGKEQHILAFSSWATVYTSYS